MTRWQPRIEMPTGKAASTVVYAVSVMFLGAALSGCSALIGATATNPDRYVRPGMTKSDLTHKLGAPLRVQQLDPPVPFLDIPGTRVIAAAGPDERDTDAPANIGPAVEKGYFRFKGRLKASKLRTVAEVGAFDVATFGVFELITTPAAIVDAARSHDHVLVAWFDQSGTALAYGWTWKKYVPK